MRLLRGLSGRVLDCGCLVGVYETYAGQVIATIDARGAGCQVPTHTLHGIVTSPLDTKPSSPSSPEPATSSPRHI